MFNLKRLIALLTFLLAVPTLAGVTVDQSQVLDRWTVHIGGYVTSLGTDIRLDGPNGTGTTISLEDDLGFSSSESVPQFVGGVILGQRHQISLSYFKTERTSSTTITKEIEWGDEVFPINIDVRAFLDTEFLTLGYTYWFYSSEKTAVGVSGGLTKFNLRSGIQVGGQQSGIGIENDIDTDLPVPQTRRLHPARAPSAVRSHWKTGLHQLHRRGGLLRRYLQCHWRDPISPLEAHRLRSQLQLDPLRHRFRRDRFRGGLRIHHPGL